MTAETTPTPVPTLGENFDDGGVRLRALSQADLPRVIESCRDEAATRWISMIPADYTEADAQWYFDKVAKDWESGAAHEFAVDSIEHGFCGTINLHEFRHSTAEIGINLGPAARGTGVAQRAVQILQDYAFNGLNLRRLYWHCVVGNWASRKLAWKNGFSFAAELPGFGPGREDAEDTWILTMTADQPHQPNEPWVGPAASPATTGPR